MDTQRRIDFLDLSNKIGRGKSFVFYSCMIFAIFSLVAALILILIPMNDPSIQNNNQIIFAKRIWSKNLDLQQNLKDNNILLHITENKQLSSDQSQENINNNKNNKNQLKKLSLTSNLIGLQSNDYYGFSQMSHNWNYSTISQEISFSYFLNEVRKSAQFLDSNGLEKVQFHTQTQKLMKFNFRDMISQKMCDNEISCKQNCLKNNNKIQEIDGQQFCDGIYQVINICAVMDFTQQKIEKGCYKDGQFEKYSFIQQEQSELKKKITHQNQKTAEKININFEIYDKLDPYVKALEISQTYEPYEQQVSEYQNASKYFFLIGGIISIAVILFYTIISAKQDKIEDNSIPNNLSIIDLTQMSSSN